MNIYLLKRTDEVDYDEYDSAVIVAESPEEAQKIMYDAHHGYEGWPTEDYVVITEVDSAVKGPVCESFNAG